MAIKNLRAPDNRSGQRDIERWQREVTGKLDNTEFTLDDAFRALFLTTGTTQGQENETAIRQVQRLIAAIPCINLSELSRAIKGLANLQAENKALRGKVTELERKIKDVEKIAWL